MWDSAAPAFPVRSQLPFEQFALAGKGYAVNRVLSRKISPRSNGDNTSVTRRFLDFSPACFCCHTSFKNHLGTFDLAET
jgi:hypothetical protein